MRCCSIGCYDLRTSRPPSDAPARTGRRTGTRTTIQHSTILHFRSHGRRAESGILRSCDFRAQRDKMRPPRLRVGKIRAERRSRLTCGAGKRISRPLTGLLDDSPTDRWESPHSPEPVGHGAPRWIDRLPRIRSRRQWPALSDPIAMTIALTGLRGAYSSRRHNRAR